MLVKSRIIKWFWVVMFLISVQNIYTFDHGPEIDSNDSTKNIGTDLAHSPAYNIGIQTFDKEIENDELYSGENRSISQLNGQSIGTSDNATEEGDNNYETEDSQIYDDYIIRRKEISPQSFIQTTILPEYIKNHRAYDNEEANSYFETATNEESLLTSSVQTAVNETIPSAIQTNVLFSDINNKKENHDRILETYNRSIEEELNGANHEDLEHIVTSGLIGTTLGPQLPPILTTSITFTTPLLSSTSSPSSSSSSSSLSPSPSTSISSTSYSTTSAPVSPTVLTTIRTKQGKQIQLNRLLPHEQLRNYFEDAYIRMPLAVIVDPSAKSLERTKILWRDALRKNFSIKIVLISLNASGMPTAYNFNNTRQFLAGLNSIKESSGGNAFVGIIQASELVPYDSAVFISTASIPTHTDLVHDAAITLLKKRIRLYLVWYGERTISENETQEAAGGILGEVAVRSGGEILHVIGNEGSQDFDGNTLTLVADNYRGSQDIAVPVDTTLSSLQIKINSMMRSATLETPNGEINLKKLVKFKSRLIDNSDIKLDAYVPLYKVKNTTIFQLKLIPEITNMNYNVYVRADRNPDILMGNLFQRMESNKMRTASIGNQNTHSHEDIRFPESSIKEEFELISRTEIKRNRSGSGLAEEQTALLNELTKIEVGVRSQLLVAPGTRAQLYFEITNLRVEPVYHVIQVVDEQRFLQSLLPENIYLRGGQTGTVVVSLMVPLNTQHGTRDKITFNCLRNGQKSIVVELKVTTGAEANDGTPPSLSWQFGSRCDTNQNYYSSSCSDRLWSLDITAQDWETGFLRLTSTPTGLIMRNSFIIGTNQPVRASYVATCCQPKVTLTVFDLAGNQRAYVVDVRDIVLSEASIAAIVLGALLLIFLIILIVILIVWCCKRKKAGHDFSSYRTRSERAR